MHIVVYFGYVIMLQSEVKRQRKDFKPDLFQQKIEFIRTKILSKYDIESCCLSMGNM